MSHLIFVIDYVIFCIMNKNIFTFTEEFTKLNWVIIKMAARDISRRRRMNKVGQSMNRDMLSRIIEWCTMHANTIIRWDYIHLILCYSGPVTTTFGWTSHPPSPILRGGSLANVGVGRPLARVLQNTLKFFSVHVLIYYRRN